jgi:hypothetical protein
MWIVTCTITRGILHYYVENTVTHERRIAPDCEKWAEEYARELNERERNDSERIFATTETTRNKD